MEERGAGGGTDLKLAVARFAPRCRVAAFPSSRASPRGRRGCRRRDPSRSARSRRRPRAPTPRGRPRACPCRAARRPRSRGAATASGEALPWPRACGTRSAPGRARVTPSRSHSARRSAGSNRASQMSAAAPVSHGRDEHVAGRLRPAGGGRDPDQVVLARADPVLRLAALRGQIRGGVEGGARLAGRARREHDQRRVSRGRDRRSDAGVSCGRSSSRTASMSAIVMHSTPPGIEPRSSSSPTQTDGFATPTLCSRSPGRSWVDIGSATAPIRHVASIVSTHSTRLPSEGHDDVAPPNAAGGERARDAGAHRDQLAEVPDPPLAVGVDRQQRRLGRRELLEDVGDEVHAPSLPRVGIHSLSECFPTLGV